MKNSLKRKTLMLFAVIAFSITMVPNVFAAKAPFENTVTEDESDIVISATADKTELSQGDEFTVTLSIDKLPSNGLGLKSFDCKLLYDSTQLTLEQGTDSRGKKLNYTELGEVGQYMNSYASTRDAFLQSKDFFTGAMEAGTSFAFSDDSTVTDTGDIVKYKFKVADNASGSITLYIESNDFDNHDAGFSASGAIRDDNNNIVTNENTKYYLKSNLSDVHVVVPTESVSFNGISSVTLDTTDNKTIDVSSNVVINPENATDADTMTWSSSDPSVATVANGVITAVGKGKAEITVSVNGKTATLPVSVTVPLTGIQFENLDSFDLDTRDNKTKDISSYIKPVPAEADVAGYTWTSSNEEVATVSQSGVVTAVGKGTATITAKAGNYSDTTTVNVSVLVNNVSFSKEKVALNTGDKTSENLADLLVYDPEDSDIKNIEWSATSSDGAITVDQNGVVTAVKKGNGTVTVTVDGKTASIPVSVTVPVSGVEVDPDAIELDLTTNPTVDATSYVSLLPEGSESDDLVWTSDDESVATVANGVITAKGKGTTTITCTVDKKYSAHISVDVTASVSSVKVNISKVVLDSESNTTKDIKSELSYEPTNADVKKLTYSSSNEEVATVDANGIITAVGKGTAVVTINADGKTTTVPVSVTVPLKSISIDKTDVTVYKGDTESIKVTANPTGAEWETLEGAIKTGSDYVTTAVKDDAVEITGVARGNSVVTISVNKAQVENLVKEVNVTVKENKITGVSVAADDDNDLLRGKTKTLKASYTTEEPETVHKTTDDTTATWTSSDEEVATVDKDGVVTGLKEGTATITVEIAGKKASYTVKVKEVHADGITISDDTIEELKNTEVTVDDTIEIPFEVSPEDCTDTLEEIKEYIDAIYDEDKVDVEVTYDSETKQGKITIKAKASGETEITLKASDEEDDVYKFTFNIAEKPVPQEEVEEEAPDTGDIQVVMLMAIMIISAAGLISSKKIFVK